MARSITRHPHSVRHISAAFCTAVALCVLVPKPALTASNGTAPGRQLWVASYGTAPKIDGARALVVSPDGATVYVTGESGSTFNYSTDYATVAYDSTTGAELWAARFDGGGSPKDGYDAPSGLAVSPDGASVFVTGLSAGLNDNYDYATVAYDAATGRRLWVQRYGGSGFDEATSLGVSPDAKTLFVTGSSWTQATGYDYATVAYDAVTGAQRWAARYDSRATSRDGARALRVSPDGASVYVTGRGGGKLHHHYDYATVAYDAATGAQRWAARYDGPDHLADTARALAVSPDGSRVFVTGSSNGASTEADFATVGYDASTGARLWVLRYDGPAHLSDVPQSIGVSADGGRVFVTGWTLGPELHDYATAAYDAATGRRLWTRGYDSSTHRQDVAFSLGVSPDGTTVYVTGSSLGRDDHYDDTTLAYDAATGRRLWIVRYPESFALSLGVSPDGSRVFVTGMSAPGAQGDFATVAYSTADPA